MLCNMLFLVLSIHTTFSLQPVITNDNSIEATNLLWKDSTINAITFATADMVKSVDFYKRCGLIESYSSETFTTMSVDMINDQLHVNIFLDKNFDPPDDPGTWNGWGRVIFHVKDVDLLYQYILYQGLKPEFEPTDAPWGERYFQILDPMGHEISFAKRISRKSGLK